MAPAVLPDLTAAGGPVAVPSGKIRILFLGASPAEVPRVDLDHEMREIGERIKSALFELVKVPAVRVSDLQAALQEHRPHVVHWSGHGEKRAGRAVLLVEDDAGGVAEIEPAALGDLFRVLGRDVRLVVLNACYSAVQAEAIAPHVPCVVGMSAAIGDRAAIAFAGAFYQALSFGQSVRTAFEAGKNRIELAHLAEVEVPKLLAREGSSPDLRLVDMAPATSGPVSLAPSALARGDDPAPIHPRVDDLFVGRKAELAALHAALDTAADDAGERVAVLEGLPGSGKSYLADRYAWEARACFPGGYVELTLGAGEAPSIEEMGGRLAGKLRLPWGGPDAWEALSTRLRSPRTLLHLENVDAEPSAEAVAALLARLAPSAAIVSGRYRGLGEAAGWPRVDVAPFDDDDAVELLDREIARRMSRADLVRVARALGGLPLALHLAAGHLAGTQTVDGFLRKLHREMDSLKPRDPADPLYAADRARAVLSRTFELSLGLLDAALGNRAAPLRAGLDALAFLPASGFGVSLGVAVSGLPPEDFDDLMDASVRLSLLTAIAPQRRRDRAFAMPTLLGGLLRARAGEGAARGARMTAWFMARLAGEARRDAWAEVERERDALSAWLAELPAAEAPGVFSAVESFAAANGPQAARQWAAALERAADILRDRGQVAEATRILRDQVAPYYDRTRNTGALDRVRALLRGENK